MLHLDEVQVTLLFEEKQRGEAKKCFSRLYKVATDVGITALSRDYERGLAVGTSEGSTYYWDFEGEKDSVIAFLNKVVELQL